MVSRDLEVQALRVESMKLVHQAETVLADLRSHQHNLETFLADVRSHAAAGGALDNGQPRAAGQGER